MKVIQFLGGLGNQMFQYAFYLSLKKRFKNVKADISGFKNYSLHHGFELEDIFPITLDKANAFHANLYNKHKRGWLNRKIRRMLGLKYVHYVEEKEFFFDTDIYSDNHARYYEGYWQNEGYFQGVEEDLKNDFSFRKPLKGLNMETANLIQGNNAVSMHVRRGDYVGHSLLGNICSQSYYQSAQNVIDLKVDNPLYLVFSDDIDWCKQNLQIKNSKYIDWNTGKDSFLDMQLMSLCKHQIIANSSFSWWAAWLNSNPDKIIIAPKKWINNQNIKDFSLLPNSWVTI